MKDTQQLAESLASISTSSCLISMGPKACQTVEHRAEADDTAPVWTSKLCPRLQPHNVAEEDRLDSESTMPVLGHRCVNGL